MKSEARIFEGLTFDEAFKKAQQSLKKDQLKPSDFSDVYPEGEIRGDEAYVRDMEAKFAKGEEKQPESMEVHKLATIFEALVHEQAELGDWLGEDVITIKPSRFDDVKNGVDDVVEFREGEAEASYLALGIDVTFGDDFEKKFSRIKQEIDAGHMGEVKYFHSEHTGFKGRLQNVPRVVVGADAKAVKELCGFWLEGETQNLSRHRIQFQILEEIILQAKAFEGYASRSGQPKIAEVYRRMGEKAERIYREKKAMTDLSDSGERDSFFDALKYSLKRFQN